MNDEIEQLAKTFNSLLASFNNVARQVKDIAAGKLNKKYQFKGDQKEALDKITLELKKKKKTEKALVRTTEKLQTANQNLQESNKRIAELTQEIEEISSKFDETYQARGVFLSNMTHGIRTPLNAILGYAQILERDSNLSSSQVIAAKTIYKSGLNLLESINKVLDISKTEVEEIEINRVDFDLEELLNGLIKIFQPACQKKDLFWTSSTFNSRVPVHGDKEILNQILINVIENAIKFTDFGGIILNVSKNKKNLFRFEVSDTGQGIPENFKDKIFQPFHQGAPGVRKGGMGVSLAISKKQAEFMGGQLTAESVEGEGTTFALEISLAPANKEIIESTRTSQEVVRLAEGQQVKALVADDADENRMVLSSLLADVGVEVIMAKNGKEAVELFGEHRPDVTFIDIRMPIMSGLKAITQLKVMYPNEKLNIIVISAYLPKNEREKYNRLGCEEMVLKPFRADQVFDSVKNLLDIKYEYKETPSLPTQIDYSKVRIPKEIISK
jgi:signal transduction histidine kinase/AmiR/NasT family two-component response regulator